MPSVFFPHPALSSWLHYGSYPIFSPCIDPVFSQTSFPDTFVFSFRTTATLTFSRICLRLSYCNRLQPFPQSHKPTAVVASVQTSKQNPGCVFFLLFVCVLRAFGSLAAILAGGFCLMFTRVTGHRRRVVHSMATSMIQGQWRLRKVWACICVSLSIHNNPAKTSMKICLYIIYAYVRARNLRTGSKKEAEQRRSWRCDFKRKYCLCVGCWASDPLHADTSGAISTIQLMQCFISKWHNPLCFRP